jgi:hypothetical protein
MLLCSADISESAAGQLLKHTWSPGFILAAVACINLKVRQDRLRAGVFNELVQFHGYLQRTMDS